MSTLPLSRWKSFRYRLEWAGCAGLAWLVRRLPRRACVGLARGLGALAYRLDTRGRRVALANLEMVLGGRTDARTRETLARRSYQSFARNIIDLLWAPRVHAENRDRYLVVEGNPRPEGARGIVYLCIHWGNFEWASIATGLQGISCQVVAESFKNPHLSAIFNGARQSAGHQIIPQENSMIRLLKQVRRGGGAGMLADLTLRPEQAAACIEAFGRPICTTLLHGVLAERGGALLIPVHGEPLPDGRTRVTYDPPLDIPPGATPAQIAQLCWDHYAPKIEARPELWLWAYKHWRYRPKAAAPADYPFYANPSGRFEKLLQGASGKTPRPKRGRKSPPPPPAD